jgi:archaetidylinositol phosphate synthase
MASPPTDFSEPAKPGVPAEVRAKRFENATRIHNGLTSNPEKRILIWLAGHTPRWINSDHLTLLGFLAQLMAGASYALARWNRYWLLAGIVFLALNWLGDSLDGTLARVRQQQRPRYGFYVDHMVDSLGGLALMGGLALSG